MEKTLYTPGLKTRETAVVRHVQWISLGLGTSGYIRLPTAQRNRRWVCLLFFGPPQNRAFLCWVSGKNSPNKQYPQKMTHPYESQSKPVLKWSAQNQVKNSEGGRDYFWLGLPLNLHFPGF